MCAPARRAVLSRSLRLVSFHTLSQRLPKGLERTVDVKNQKSAYQYETPAQKGPEDRCPDIDFGEGLAIIESPDVRDAHLRISLSYGYHACERGLRGDKNVIVAYAETR
jgi:hypothetical protein